MFSAQSNESSVVLEGHYQGKIYMYKILLLVLALVFVLLLYINDDVTTDQVNSSAFEIDFSNTPVKKGDPVTVRIQHKKDCLPKVLNPEVLRPGTLVNLSINVDKDQI